VNSTRATALVLTLGSVLAGVGLLHPNPPHGSSFWLGLATSYLLAGVVLGGVRVLREDTPVTFASASAVAVLSVLVVVGLRVSRVLAARPELHLAETSFVLEQFPFLVSFVVAVMVPLGAAASGARQGIVAGFLVLPFVVATGRGLLHGLGFGPAFVMLYYGVVLFAGVLAGLPLFLYTRGLRTRFSQNSPEPNTTA